MYEEYFSLSGAPFRLNPDPEFFFGSRSHNKAMTYLHYGLKQAESFIVITGRMGVGKSTVIGHLLGQLEQSEVVAAHLQAPDLKAEALLSHILSAFHIDASGEGRAAEMEALEDYLLDQLRRGRRALLIMDEAQRLPLQALEELRTLSEADYDGTPLFQVFLVGQPDFRETIQSSAMEQLRRRIIASYHLEALSEAETREYILHRLSVVGWREDPVFTDEAIALVFQETDGLPRRVNALCDRLMLYCALEKRHEISGAVVKTVLAALREEKLNAREESETLSAPVSERPDSPENGDTPFFSIWSEFDRIIAKRRARAAAKTENRQEATLSDVASAIAAVGVDPAGDLSNDNKPRTSKASVTKAAGRDGLPPLTSIAKSVADTRDELKEAHAMILRLRKAETERSHRREEHRAKAKASLARADALIKQARAFLN